MEFICVFITIAGIIAIIVESIRVGKAKKLVAKPKLSSESQQDRATSYVTFSMQVGGQRIPMGSDVKITQAKFICQREPISLMGRSIPAPLVYITKQANGDLTNPGIIDLSLSVSKRSPANPPELPYWPSYNGMSPKHRAAYLDWLAQGRTAPIPMGYVFIFFYGLERRLLANHDRAPIRQELRRLLNIYGDNHSFEGYAIRLLSFDALRNLTAFDENHLESAFPLLATGYHSRKLALSGQLTWYAINEKPVPVHLAMEAAKDDPRTTNSVVATRVSEEMTTLFSRRYHETFGDGLILRPGKNTLFEYSPASSTLRYELEITGNIEVLGVNYPDPLSQPRQLRKLADLYDGCIDELRSFSRAIGADGTDELTPEKWEKLPPELKAEVPHPNEKLWGEIARQYLNERGIITPPAGAVAPLCGIGERDKLTRTQCRTISQTATDLGYAVEPNPHILPQSWKWDDTIALVKVPDARSEPPARYKVAALLTYLGVYIAGADGSVDDEEIQVIHDTLEQMFDLAETELHRIDGLMSALSNAKISMRGVSDLVEDHLFKAQREQLGELLVLVAAADGKLDKNEKTYLKRAFNALDLNPDDAVRKAEALLKDDTPALSDPVTVRAASDADDGEAIPPRTSTQAKQKSAVVLNAERISQIRRETREVADMLGKALTAGEEPSTSEAPKESTQGSSSTPVVDQDSTASSEDFSGLQERYIPFLKAILAQPEWSEDQLRQLASEHRLMLAAAISVINEWSDDQLGGFLIQEAEPYLIRVELLKEETKA